MEETTGEPLAQREWPWMLALGLAAFLAFLPAVNYPFLIEWDDCVYVTAPELAPSWANVAYWLSHDTIGLFTPVAMWSLMLDRWLFGLTPLAFHLHAQLLHCLAALLLFGVARHLRLSPWAAFSLALLWAVHPQRVESVAWIAERRDVLAGVFTFGSVLLFMRSFDRGRLPWAATAALFLALDAKPSTILLPVAMAVYALWRRPKLDSLRYLVPVMAAAGAHCLFFYMHSGSMHGVLERFPRLVLVPLHNALWYLLTTFVPFELNPLYPQVGHETRTWLVLAAGGGVALAVLLLGGFGRRQFMSRTAPFVAAWLCFFMPVSCVVRFGNFDHGDRYNYLLSAVAWLALGALADRWARDAFRRKLAATAVLGAAAAYLFLTWSYLPFWQDTKTLFVRAVEGVAYPNQRAVLGLGVVGLRREQPALLEAAGDLCMAMAAGNDKIPLPEDLKNPEALYTTGLFFAGMALKFSGQPAAAARTLQAAEAKCRDRKLILPGDVVTRFWGELADCYLEAGQPQDARRCLRNQLSFFAPGTVEALFCRGMVAFLGKDYPAAQREWRAALALSPDDAKTLHNLRNLEANYLQDGRGGAR